jgi:hypothetical protein
MAHMAWSIERLVASALGRPVERHELALEQRRRQPAAEPDTPIQTPVVYHRATEVPEHWIPLLPVAQDNQGTIRLRRGAQEPVAPTAQGRILEPGRPLSLYEEEVPRAGARVTRAYQYARWHDGSMHVWIGRRKGPGRGEGFSGLRFDVAEETGVSAATTASVNDLRAGGAFNLSRFDQGDGFTDED